MDRGQDKQIRRQVSLPVSKAFAIAVKGITIRFWRSLITAGGVVLAIAFFTAAMSRDVFYRSYRELAFAREEPNLPSEAWRQHARLFLQKQGLLAGPSAGADPLEAKKALRTQRSRRIWIIVMSLAVCFLGIVNAQLMSVSERFREIGTMKCLGALDGFIVAIFVIESLLQGLLGSLCGMVLGLLLTLVQLRVSFGAGAFAAPPVLDLVKWIVIVLAIGTGLSMAAAIAPAVRAARMLPADAMRVQE